MEGKPNVIVALVQVAYVLLVLGAFLRFTPRRAMLASIITGLLLLPVFDETFYSVPILHTKRMFVPGVVAAASLLFDWSRWRRFRPSAADLPMAILCLAPVATSISNGLGAYDGFQAALQVTLGWGVPYLLGRLYLGSAAGMKDLAQAVVLGALAYVPFCLWEVRMAPVLHYTVYGYSPSHFGQSIRFGGYRPTVFMDHGLMVGMFLAGGALIATWLWRTQAVRRLAGIPMGWVAVILLATTVLAKSTGAIVLLVAGIGVLGATRRYRTALFILALACVPPVYAAARMSGWSATEVARLARSYVNEDRARSFEFRIRNENMLAAKALERPVLGWGRWGRGRVYDEDGQDTSTTDGMWIIALSTGGLLALVASLAAVGLPTILMWKAFPARSWARPSMAPTVAVLVWLLLWGVDNLANAMLTPLFPLAAGALTSLYVLARVTRGQAEWRQGSRVRRATASQERFAPSHGA